MVGSVVKRRDLISALRAVGALPVAGGKGSHERWHRIDATGKSWKTTIPHRSEFSSHFVATIARQLGVTLQDVMRQID